MGENERISRAAGYAHDSDYEEYRQPDWRTDPGAVAKYLLPVLEKRVPEVAFKRGHNGLAPMYFAYESEDAIKGNLDCLVAGYEWHEAVIEAVLATGEEA